MAWRNPSPKGTIPWYGGYDSQADLRSRMNMALTWHYSIDGKKHGPVGSADLKRLADAGELSPQDLVWKGRPGCLGCSF